MRTCKFEGCANRHVARGWCGSHYSQWQRRGELSPIGTPRPGWVRARRRDEHGRKLCRKCRRWLTEDQFHKNRACPDGLMRDCRECSALHSRSIAYNCDVKSLVAQQGGVCAICGDPLVGRWGVDHDHSCCPEPMKSCGKCVRGLLCERCNLGLGQFRDSLEIMRAAIEYLEARH